MTRPSPQQVDAGLAALLLVGAVLAVVFDEHHKLGVALMASVTIAPIAVRRRYPTLVGAGVPALGAVDHTVFDPQYVGYPIATFCAMYALAVWTPPRRLVLGLAVFLVANVAVGGVLSRIGLLYAAGSTLAMILVREAVVGRERRAELAEREREVAAREAVAGERARIARELHDAVAHDLSLMVVQAGAERHALGSRGTSAGPALGAIEELGRGSLVELRQLLGMLRGEHAPAPR